MQSRVQGWPSRAATRDFGFRIAMRHLGCHIKPNGFAILPPPPLTALDFVILLPFVLQRYLNGISLESGTSLQNKVIFFSLGIFICFGLDNLK